MPSHNPALSLNIAIILPKHNQFLVKQVKILHLTQVRFSIPATALFVFLHINISAQQTARLPGKVNSCNTGFFVLYTAPSGCQINTTLLLHLLQNPDWDTYFSFLSPINTWMPPQHKATFFWRHRNPHLSDVVATAIITTLILKC